MPNRNYARGFRAEDRALKELRAEGYWSQRAYGSKGVYDLVAVGKELVRFIEIKRSKRNIVSEDAIANQYKEDIAALNKIPDQASVSKELWLWIDTQFNPPSLLGPKIKQKAGWRKFHTNKEKELNIEEFK